MKRNPRSLHGLQTLYAGALPLALFGLSVSACGDPYADLPTALNPDERAGQHADPDLMAPEGWTQLRIRSHYTDITVDASGHFSIERNNCWVAGAGALDLKPWNRLVKVMNTWMKRGDTRKRACTKLGTDIRSFDGWLEVAQDPQPAPPPGGVNNDDNGGFGGMRIATFANNDSPIVRPPSPPSPPASALPQPPSNDSGSNNNPPALPPTTTVPGGPRPPVALPNPINPQPFPSPSASPMIVWTKAIDSEYEGNTCTTWGTAQEATELVAVLDEIIPVIFSEDCTMPPS